jgi:hypothetical protein
VTTELQAIRTTTPDRIKTYLGWARGAAALGVASALVEATTLTFTKAGGSGHFKYAADYWLTAAGPGHAIACVVLVLAVHRLQDGRDGRLGAAAVIVNAVACAVLTVQMAVGLITSTEAEWGPVYPLATLASFVGLSLFAKASWRAGVVPRALLAAWPVVWVIGSMAAFGPTPLLLSALYVALVVVLARRAPYDG